MKAELLVPSYCTLGEGTLWHNGRRSLFWVDIEGRILFEFNPSNRSTTRWDLPQRVSAVFESKDSERVVVALEDGLAFFHLPSRQLDWHVHIEKHISSNRGNDGKCDARGRIWLGTMDIDCRDHCGALYRIDRDNTVAVMLKPLSVPNGMAWTSDNATMYFIDTPTRKINAYAFDLEKGEMTFSRTAVDVPPDMGMPDGMCIDAEGMLWVAHWGGYGVYHWDPITGTLLGKIDIPCPYVTNCAFGDDDLRTLYITTAKSDLAGERLRQYPLSGSVFTTRPGVQGTAAFVYDPA